MSDLYTRSVGVLAILFGAGSLLDLAGHPVGQAIADAGMVVLFAGFVLFGLKMLVDPDPSEEDSDE